MSKKCSEPRDNKTGRKVLKHLKTRNKNMFTATKAGTDFKGAMFDYMADFIFNEMEPDTYGHFS